MAHFQSCPRFFHEGAKHVRHESGRRRRIDSLRDSEHDRSQQRRLHATGQCERDGDSVACGVGFAEAVDGARGNGGDEEEEEKGEAGSEGGGRLAAATTLSKYGIAIKISQDGIMKAFYPDRKNGKVKTLFTWDNIFLI